MSKKYRGAFCRKGKIRAHCQEDKNYQESKKFYQIHSREQRTRHYEE